MRVTLDDRPLPDQPTLAAALKLATEHAQKAGRIVVEAYLDGAAVPDSVLASPLLAPGGSDLRLVSVNPKTLVRVTLADAADALDAAAEDQRHSAELIQSGKLDESLRPLSTAIQTWQAVRDAVEKGAQVLELPLDTIAAPGADAATLPALIADLTARLEEVRRALAAQDWSGLADVLAYDLADQAERWKALLSSLAATIKAD